MKERKFSQTSWIDPTLLSDSAQLLLKAAQMNQLQSQMSPTHKQTLHYSLSTQQLTHRAAASAVLSLLTDMQLSSLERCHDQVACAPFIIQKVNPRALN